MATLEKEATPAQDLEKLLLDIARICVAKGPGYAQENAVLRLAQENLEIGEDLAQQQRLLTAWHDLFRKGILAWGYDLANPTTPFFHFAERQEPDGTGNR